MQSMKRSYKSTRMTFIFAILGPNHRVKLGDGAAQLHKFRPRSHSSCRARPTRFRGGVGHDHVCAIFADSAPSNVCEFPIIGNRGISAGIC